MSKYEPPMPDGRKAWVVTLFDWGRHRSVVVWAADRTEARWEAEGRKTTGVCVDSIRRATPDDVRRDIA